MRVGKERLTVTVDPHLVEAAQNAVAEGQIESLSAWVNPTLTERAERRRTAHAGFPSPDTEILATLEPAGTDFS
jgi:hypothetical protein